MATQIGLLSATEIQNLSQSQPHHNENQPQSSNPKTNTLMWNPDNPKEQEDDEESWEVRAFAEDTKNVMDTTWPPRSYTCSFCRREFRSAQALGGHMNVHRRDRARVHQSQPPNTNINIAPSSLILYHLPNGNNAPFLTHRATVSACAADYYPPNNLMMMMPTCMPHHQAVTGFNGFSSHCNKLEISSKKVHSRNEELDLELRL